MKRFTEFPLSIELLEALHDQRFLRCTPIQEKVIPIALEGKDIAGMAQTGTGKTLGFLVPILQMLVPNGEVQTLIICPTRELAIQVGAVSALLGESLGVKTAVVYGGTALGHQRKMVFAGPDIIVGTPGRVIDFIKTAVIRLRHLNWLVLDEADRMLDMGFIDEVDFILRSSPLSRQTMLFSATLQPEVMKIASRYMHEPERVQVNPTKILADRVEQKIYRVSEDRKADLLVALVKKENPELCLVFAGTREATTRLARLLRAVGFEAGALSSLQTQRVREGIVRMFKDREFHILVATDVAARGLDIDGITHVFNFEVPRDADDYVHRIGRTARAGKAGKAITLVSGSQDEKRLQAIQKLTGMVIQVGEHRLAQSAPFTSDRRSDGHRSAGPGSRDPRRGSSSSPPRGGRGGRSGSSSSSSGRSGRPSSKPVSAGSVSAGPIKDAPITAKPVGSPAPADSGKARSQGKSRRQRSGSGSRRPAKNR
jgi:superfamily II DNA/RNA helicase